MPCHQNFLSMLENKCDNKAHDLLPLLFSLLSTGKPSWDPCWTMNAHTTLCFMYKQPQSGKNLQNAFCKGIEIQKEIAVSTTKAHSRYSLKFPMIHTNDKKGPGWKRPLESVAIENAFFWHAHSLFFVLRAKSINFGEYTIIKVHFSNLTNEFIINEAGIYFRPFASLLCARMVISNYSGLIWNCENERLKFLVTANKKEPEQQGSTRCKKTAWGSTQWAIKHEKCHTTESIRTMPCSVQCSGCNIIKSTKLSECPGSLEALLCI